jgi:hypothetical protein
MTVWHYVWIGFVLVALVGYTLLRSRAGGGGQDLSLADRADPRKHWAQAAIALYQDSDDPAYWSQDDARHLIQNGWSTPDRNELVELIQRYIGGECNVGFDKLRIIFLARLGRGAGWFDDVTSWDYVFPAIGEIQSRYGSWEELKVAMDEGRADWYGGASEVPKAQHELAKRGWANLARNFLGRVAFR